MGRRQRDPSGRGRRRPHELAAFEPLGQHAEPDTVDLVNRLEAEGRADRQGRLADYLTRLDFVILDELGYLPFAQKRRRLIVRPTLGKRSVMWHFKLACEVLNL